MLFHLHILLIILFHLTDHLKTFIFIKTNISLSPTVSLGQEFKRGDILARRLSRGCRQDTGRSWEQSGGQLRTGWSSLHYVSGQKRRDGRICSVIVLQQCGVAPGMGTSRGIWSISVIIMGTNSLFNFILGLLKFLTFFSENITFRSLFLFHSAHMPTPNAPDHHCGRKGILYK